MKKVMVFGTFDALHPGHESFFKQAKQHGDFLIAVVARDKTVSKIKGRLPDFSEVERKKMVGQNKYVDLAVLGKYRNKHEIIGEHQPEVICLGYDQTHFIDNIESEIKKIGLETRVVRLKPYQAHIYKSSLLRLKK
ncbi:FAD synthase [Patescibacteria group bacterium]|nr:FAD synthase [Patescibacteria group bacterium]MBU1921611.1 FAD synthase [Patescibacteria group bacterium]